MHDPVSDLVTRIKNAYAQKHSRVSMDSSRLKLNMLKVLKEQGLIRDYSSFKTTEGLSRLDVELKYINSKPVLTELKQISRPGLRVYKGVSEFPKIKTGYGVLIISTPQGVLSHFEAKRKNVGGELLCSAF